MPTASVGMAPNIKPQHQTLQRTRNAPVKRRMDFEQRCQPIELILSDVDGVMTDGRLIYDNQGIETKQFHVRDGQGIRLWKKAGFQFGLLSLRSSQIVRTRAAELNLTIVRQGAEDKVRTTRQILQELGLDPQRTCYLGDDLPDLPVLRFVGLGVAVADACSEVRDAAHHVTAARGGEGAVREIVETILKIQGRWEDAIRPYVC